MLAASLATLDRRWSPSAPSSPAPASSARVAGGEAVWSRTAALSSASSSAAGATLEYYSDGSTPTASSREASGAPGMSSTSPSSSRQPTVEPGHFLRRSTTDWKGAAPRLARAVVRNCSRIHGCSRRAGLPVIRPPALRQCGRQPISFVVLTSASYARLRSTPERSLAGVARTPASLKRAWNTDLRLSKPGSR